MPKKNRVIQQHHITYEPEWTVPIYAGEHQVLTKIQWYCKKNVSKGFIIALRHFIKEWAGKTTDLNKELKCRKRLTKTKQR